MPISITMPRMSDTMEEGTIVKWNVKVGDKVSSGDHLADVETDKATMELESFDEGTIAHIATPEGSSAAVGELIVVLAEEGEDVEEAAKSAKSGGSDTKEAKPKAEPKAGDGESDEAANEKSAPSGKSSSGSGREAEPAKAPAARPPAHRPHQTPTPAAAGSGGGRTRISPVARKMAEEMNIDYTTLTGSGPDGRIVKRDVQAAGERGHAPAASQAGSPKAKPQPSLAIKPLFDKTVSVTNMRKTIARVLVESKQTAPHFQVTVSVNADPLLGLRGQVNRVLEAQGIKLSVNDFIVRATTIALTHHPEVNSSWTGDGIELFGSVNMGVAVALPAEKGGGLVVPTLYECENMDLATISSETKRLAQKARTQGLTLDEMSNGTFTISNLGMFGVEHFTAIINPPQCAILAVGAANQKPVVRNGELTIGHEMSLTISADHRVIDGAIAAQFLSTLKTMLENPAGMLV